MSKAHAHFTSHLELIELEKFSVGTLIVESDHLKGNILGDSAIRRNPVMVPKAKAPSSGWPVVLVLSGLFGNGTLAFNVKVNQSNMPQSIDQLCKKKEAPEAVYVFCDALTFWGGSQFLNSAGTGQYEDYIIKDLLPAVLKHLPVSHARDHWCVTGGSSGGYGALHLASRYSERFGLASAIAPDSFFEASLLPDLYTALPVIRKLGVKGVKEEILAEKFSKRKDSHQILNAIAMGLCYAPVQGAEDVQWPLDMETGRVIPEVWQKWKAHDPVEFLRVRESEVKKINHIYLDVGTRDQFQLQFGTRQIRDVCNAIGVSHSYREFEGNHFEIGERRPEVWKWLVKTWN